MKVFTTIIQVPREHYGASGKSLRICHFTIHFTHTLYIHFTYTSYTLYDSLYFDEYSFPIDSRRYLARALTVLRIYNAALDVVLPSSIPSVGRRRRELKVFKVRFIFCVSY